MDEQQNNAPDGNWSFTSDDSSSIDSAHIETLSWSASEYIAHEKTAGWFIGGTLVTLVLTTAIFLLTDELLASLTILVVAFSTIFFAARKPDVKQYELSDTGLRIDNKKYHFSEFRSFSIVEEGAINSIWLRSLGRFSPMIVIYYAPEDETTIIESLSTFLPHEQRDLDPIDRMTRRLRF